MIISYYGDGKGKTTAALGIALRASGYDKKILFAQFIKGEFKSGEDEALKKIRNLTHKKFGLGFVGILGDKRRISEHKDAAEKGLKFVADNLDDFDIVILDEIFGAVKGRLLETKETLSLLKKCKAGDIVMTGRPKISVLLEASDLVTEMRAIKHPFNDGVKAKEGIDY